MNAGVTACGGDAIEATITTTPVPQMVLNPQPLHLFHRWSGSLPGAASINSLPLAAAASADFGNVASSSPSHVSFVVAIDEKLSINWFGEDCPPYWRRALNQSDIPVQVTTAC